MALFDRNMLFSVGILRSQLYAQLKAVDLPTQSLVDSNLELPTREPNQQTNTKAFPWGNLLAWVRFGVVPNMVEGVVWVRFLGSLGWKTNEQYSDTILTLVYMNAHICRNFHLSAVHSGGSRISTKVKGGWERDGRNKNSCRFAGCSADFQQYIASQDNLQQFDDSVFVHMTELVIKPWWHKTHMLAIFLRLHLSKVVIQQFQEGGGVPEQGPYPKSLASFLV